MAAAKKTESMSNKTTIGIGVGVTAALLSAAGAYFLYGSKDASKNRKMVKSWSLKAKAEVLEGLEKAKNMSKEEYNMLVDKTMKSYSKLKGASAVEIAAIASEMKSHWKSIEKKGEMRMVTPKKIAKKAVKKVAKMVK